jgi:hypothetical protein
MGTLTASESASILAEGCDGYRPSGTCEKICFSASEQFSIEKKSPQDAF